MDPVGHRCHGSRDGPGPDRPTADGAPPITRREFCRTVVAGAVAGLPAMACASQASPPATRRDPRVVIGRDDGVWSGSDLNTPRIARLLDASVQRLTGKTQATGAWKALFAPSDRVVIKINCLAGRALSSHRELIEALVLGIQEAGVGASQITVFERTAREMQRAGYDPRARLHGVRVIATDMKGLSDTGYEREIRTARSVGSCFSRVLTRGKTAVVSVPVLKDHDLAGVTLGMKNFFGVIHTPNKYHDNHCDPFIADLNSSPLIRDKLRLVVCDALQAQCHAGPNFSPAWAWKYSGVLVSSDPVALDAVGAKLIEDQRRAKGLPSLAEAKRPPTWIRTAAGLGLGVADLDAIETVHV